VADGERLPRVGQRVAEQPQPLDLQLGGAQPLRQAPAAQLLHRPGAHHGRARMRRGLGPPLEDARRDAGARQRDRRDEPGGTGAHDHNFIGQYVFHRTHCTADVKSSRFAAMKLALSLAAAAVLAVALPPVAGAPSTGTGTVFLPNPVADLQDQTLTDQKDTDYPALQPAYHDVTLTNLDGSGRLVGDWVNIHNQTGKDVVSATNTFRFHRDQGGFEQVMAYYW